MNSPDRAIFRSVREGVTVRDELLEVETKDGSKRYILNYTAPLKNEQGKIKGGMIANLDISKRVAAQRKAEEAEQRIRLIFDTSPNCLFIKDKLGRYVLANHATASLFNTTEKYLIGKTDEELHGGRWEQNQAESSEHELCEERWFVAKNGAPRWFRFFTAPISLPSYAGIELTIAVDITETRQVQEELRQSEAQKGMILDSLNSQVVMLDRDLSVLWANKTAVEQKIDDQNCPVHCYETSTHVLQPCKPCAGCPTRDALESGAPAHATRKTGDGRTLSVSANPILDEKGEVYRVVVTSVDITERLSLERQLRQAQKMESLGTLAGGIAHDFNNILAALLGYADLARIRLKEQPVVQGYLEQVAIAGKRATELVRQILTFSRRQDADLQPLQVPLVIKEALKLLRSTLPTSVELEVSINTAVDPVLADPTQIHQIIMNLCINASHAMEPDGGTLTVKIDQVNPGGEFFIEHQELSPGPYLRLQVSDTGCGMTPEIISSIFDPYFSTKDQGEGTGLGLSVVHGIIKQYQGEIVVDSTLGKGTTFFIYLPVVPQKETLRERGIVQQMGGRGEHILLVDDEPILCKFYQQFLESQGYRITTCTDPMRALTLFESAPDDYDLVLTDVTMPGITGDKLGQRILARRPGLPVLLMTGYTKILNDEQAQVQGFRALLTKPVPQKDLLVTLRAVLDQTQQERQ